MYINIECIDLGAYNLSNKIIKIFKGGDAYTITHEFSHYLQDVLFKKSDRERYAKDLDYRELIEDEAFEIGDMIGFVYKDLIPKIKECKEIPPVSERRARLCKELAEYIHEYAYRVTWILEREHLDRAKEFLNHIEYSMKEIAKNAEIFITRLALLHIACKGKFVMPTSLPEGNPFRESAKIAEEIKKLARQYLMRTGEGRLRVDEGYKILELRDILVRKVIDLRKHILGY